MDLQNGLPVIDWEQALKVTGNQPDLAEDLLTLLTRNLAKEVTTIKQFHSEQNYSEMQKMVHKLHDCRGL